MANRLIHESSPYLLQHADNPVDWYPWGEEAFAKARAEDKPIFLSIGYSTCHWCHVMEHESFEDREVAELMNDAFVSIKVDREERPDIDGVYMTVCQLLTGGGGWPLTAVLTPEGRPFFAGTYFPKRGRFGRPGMLELVPALREAWRTRREELTASADRLTEALQRATAGAPGVSEAPGAAGDRRAAGVPSAAGETRAVGAEPAEAHLRRTYEILVSSFDSAQGGFGSAPKFPTPHNLSFLLRWWHRTGADRALEMVGTTLGAMRMGGIWDHVGFGFHRYSTDARWFVPHFEKMLYDQALLAIAYIEVWQATGAPELARTARETLTYVRRDLTDEGGGFYSAEDADSEGVEGKFYLWTTDELRARLGDEFDLVRRVYNLEERGNFAEEATGHRTGANILHLRRSPARIAEDLGLPEEELFGRLEAARRTLLAAREERVRPGLDDKVLADWNGLAIAAFAKAGAVFDEPAWTEMAERAADFILREMRDDEGRLLHRWRRGEAGIGAMADDYAFLVWGLIELYETSGAERWLAEALRLDGEMAERFWDAERGGYFVTPADGERLIARAKESHDGAVPSANSVAMENLLRLARLTGDAAREERAAAIGRAFAGALAQAPAAHTRMLCALDFALGPSREVVVAGDAEDPATEALLRVVRRSFLPRAVWLVRSPDGVAGSRGGAGGEPAEAPSIERLAPFTAGMDAVGGRPAAYVCTDFACERPVTVPEELAERLGVPVSRPAVFASADAGSADPREPG